MGSHSHSHASTGLGIAFALNTVFTVIEVAGGFWTNSVAILSDAVHDAGDSISLGVAWYLQRLAARESNEDFTFGYRRFSTLGALFIAVVLLAGLSFVIWSSALRLSEPAAVRASGMIALAVVGIVVNGAAVLRLRGGESLNEKVVSWHLLEDVLGWTAVLAGSIAIALGASPIIDPILAIGISCFILWNVVKNLRKVAHVFLQRAPEGFDVDRFQRQVETLPLVVSEHHTHAWTLDGERHVLSLHLVMKDESTRQDITCTKTEVHRLLNGLPFDHIAIDVELEGECCLMEQDHQAQEQE